MARVESCPTSHSKKLLEIEIQLHPGISVCYYRAYSRQTKPGRMYMVKDHDRWQSFPKSGSTHITHTWSSNLHVINPILHSVAIGAFTSCPDVV
ncbi:hypothetical protein M408DRAFT_240013 [Serendipita vermifera MAFF 305830]|uniref:Uncharacterized protein n=1 Tax=Serendipita vermifera MAFF 305830 TaxID=933852 RepID=A0A0C3BK52_SERVB|nr:hypothetical protein M408DRAFT_240013 [Serendipita vermifera MAFF 305830]